MPHVREALLAAATLAAIAYVAIAAALGGVLLIVLGCLKAGTGAGVHPRMGPETMVSETA